MSLKIGEVSRLFDMSVETIRFYESQNIMRPSRKADNQYRLYETWDIFFLMECLKYKSYGLSIKDVAKLLHAESLEFFREKLDDSHALIEENIRYSTLLNEKIGQYRANLETVEWNQGNFWMKKLPEQFYFFYVKSQDEQYEDIVKTNPLFKNWIKFLPFVEFGDHIAKDDLWFESRGILHRWSLIIERQIAELLKLPMNDSVASVPPQFYLCSIIDAGERGEMTWRQFTPIMEYIQKNDYEICGDLISKLLTRVHKQGRLCRYFEVQVPIAKK